MSLTRRSLLCCLFIFALALSACGNDTGSGNNDNNGNNGGQDADARVDAGEDVAEDTTEDTAEDAEEDTTDDAGDVTDADDVGDDGGDDVGDDGGDTGEDATDGGDDADASGAECGDGVIEGDEDCDGSELGGATCSSEGFVDGTLACNNCQFDTSSCNTCGDDTVNGSDVCDGSDLDGASCSSQGFVGGTLSCTATCDGYDTSSCNNCGNDTVDSGETCDGTDLDAETCESQGFDGGTLGCEAACGAYDTSGCFDNPAPGAAEMVITEIMQNPSALADSDGEYFELLNPSGSTTYNLKGCEITGGATEPTIDITVDLEVAPGTFFTIARSASPGFTPDHVDVDLRLSNSSDRVALECPDGSGGTVVVDEVSWDDGASFPDPNGASMNLTDETTATDAAENDNGYWWCATQTSDLGNGDLGTPGTANEVCPTDTVDYCVLQFPKTLTATENTSEDFFGQLYIAGVTDQTTTANDPRGFIEAEFGYGPTGSDPSTDPNWVWNTAVPNSGWNPSNNNDDEYLSTITLPAVGTYDTAYRFSGNYGRTFTYCDASETTTTYETTQSGTLTTTAATTSVSAYFSEYIEGSSNNKGLEIYNSDTTTPVDLSGCSLNRYSNGKTAPATYSFPTGATIPANDVYTVCNSSIDGAYSALCDDLDGWASWNGDDAIELVCNGQTLDVFGQIGFDPGSQWSANGVSTSNQTLGRKCSVTSGDTDGSDPFDPSVEWNQSAQDDFTDFGGYSCSNP